jgi:putative ABC transport system permease protein
VAIATGALVSMVGFALGIQAQVEEPFQRMELVNRIDVHSRRPVSNTFKPSSAPSATKPLKSLDDAALAAIERLPGVLLAYPVIKLESVHVSYASQERTGPVVGLPLEAARLRFVHESLIAGGFFQSGTAREIILGRRLAQALGFAGPEEAVGQRVRLDVKGLVPTSDGKLRPEEKRVELQVVGIWNPPAGQQGYAADGCVVPLPLMKELPGIQVQTVLGGLWHTQTDPNAGYNSVAVRVQKPSDLFSVAGRIQEMGFETHMLLDQFKNLQKNFILFDLLLTAVGMVALVVAGLGIINTLLMAVLERVREIGVYKALGASASDIRTLFLGEAALVGLFGGAGGLVLGRVVSWIIELVVNHVAYSQGIDQPIMAFAFPFQLLGGAVAFALVVSLASGVYPALRAARIDPIRALRAE